MSWATRALAAGAALKSGSALEAVGGVWCGGDGGASCDGRRRGSNQAASDEDVSWFRG